MSILIRYAAWAVLMLVWHCHGNPALAMETKEQRHQLVHDFKEGLRIYEEGQYVRGLAQMESALAILQENEKRGFEEFPESFTEEEARSFLYWIAFGGLYGWRKKMVNIYLDHGCYEKAQSLAERNLALFKRMPDSLSEEVRTSEIYRKTLFGVREAAARLGQFDRAIKLQTQILELDREAGQGPLGIAYSLRRLASLHGEAGNSQEARKYAEEARAAFNEVWDQRSTSEATRRSVEASLFMIEGRHDEAKAVLDENLTLELAREGPNDPNVIWAYIRLASVYGDLGDAESEREALDSAFRLLLDPKPKTSPYLPDLAHALVELLQKSDRAAEVNQLVEKYYLCA